MPNRRRKNRSRKRRQNTGNPAENVSEYNGPLVIKSDRQERTCIAVVTGFFSYIATAIAGSTVSNVFTDDPSYCNSWAGYYALWDEYRVLRLDVWFQPAEPFNKATTVSVGPVGVVVDHTPQTDPLTSMAQAVDYSSFQFKSLSYPWKMHITMSGIEESYFASTASPTIHKTIKIWGEGLELNTTFGYVVQKYRIQFRGQKDGADLSKYVSHMIKHADCSHSAIPPRVPPPRLSSIQ